MVIRLVFLEEVFDYDIFAQKRKEREKRGKDGERDGKGKEEKGRTGKRKGGERRRREGKGKERKEEGKGREEIEWVGMGRGGKGRERETRVFCWLRLRVASAVVCLATAAMLHCLKDSSLFFKIKR